MRLKRLKYVIIVVIILLVLLGIWNVSKKLISVGVSTESKIAEEMSKNEVEYPEVEVDLEVREEVETTKGVKLKQTGTYEDKAVQCVYDYFKSELPELDVFNNEYELKDLGDNNYCVYVGDWYVFVKGEYDICYTYMICKSSELTEYELNYIEENGIEVSESGGVYSWEN